MPMLTDRGLHASPNRTGPGVRDLSEVVEIDLDPAAGGEGGTPSLPPERRRHPRYAAPSMYAAVRATFEDGVVIDGHLRDISVGGATFESPMAVGVGARLEFEIELPAGAATLRGVARTVRVEREHEALEDTVIAIEFERFENRFEAGTLTHFLEQGCLPRTA